MVVWVVWVVVRWLLVLLGELSWWQQPVQIVCHLPNPCAEIEKTVIVFCLRVVAAVLVEGAAAH